ncbi:hypothetical protein ACN74_01700, partial [Escherichia coli]
MYGNYLSFFVIKNAVSCWIGVMRAAFRKRPIWALLRRQAELDGMPAINAKRVYRIMRQNALL